MFPKYFALTAAIICFQKIMDSTTLVNFTDIQCGKIFRPIRIVGGSDAISGEFPWLVSLTKLDGHFCSGSLITKKHILTAGHCVCSGISNLIVPPSHLKVTLGQHDLNRTSSASYQVNVKSIAVHPNYKCNKVNNDIAILELENDVIWSNNVLPACLSKLYESDNSAVVAGWGWLSENSTKGRRANILQKAFVNIISNEECQEWFKSQGKKVKIRKGQLCAGHENGGIDACWGDSGGPLMVNFNKKQFTIVGIVSTGIGCARPKLPGIYTRISEYSSWIEQVLQQ